MNGFLNVKALPRSISAVSAAGDGCKDDTAAIQAAVDALKRSDATPSACTVLTPPSAPLGTWAPYYAGLYFPAGVYRITAPIVMPYMQQTRLFGDGGRGGELLEPDSAKVPAGSLIRQDTDGEPIFVFDAGDSFGIAVERLGFIYAKRQLPPPGWTEDGPSQHLEPGACAILFSAGGRPGFTDENYYHIRITDCTFSRGWRGVSIDDTYRDGSIALFATQIDHCTFHQHAGAAVSLVNYSSGSGGPEPTIIGMTGNSLRDLFIENYNYLSGGVVTSRSNNVEPQIRLLAQAGCTLDGIDAEGSKRPVISTADCVMQITNLYLEHVEIAGLYPKMLYFGGGRYSLHGMNLDGILYAKDDPNTGGPSFSTLINGDAGAEIVISGVRSNPFPPKPAGQDTRDPDVDGGLLPYNGPLCLVGGTSATYHLLDRPQLPNYSEAQRGTVTYEPEEDPPDMPLPYEEAFLYAGDQNTAAVRAPTAKAITGLSFGTIAAGQIVSKTVGICVGIFPGATPPAAQAIPNARPGDVVSLGPPADLPAGLVATGLVVSPGCVEIRLHNTLGSDVAVPTQTWTVETGGGPNGGAPQIISSGVSSGSAYPLNR